MPPLIGQSLAGIAKACEAWATAAEHSEQAQRIFDELRLPSNPIIVSASVVLTIVAPS